VAELTCLKLSGFWDPKEPPAFEKFPLYQLPFSAAEFSHVLRCSADSHRRI